MGLVLALDQGTTSSRGIVFDEKAEKLGLHQIALPQIFPQAGWVEHDPRVIWQQQLEAAQQALAEAKVGADHISALGITNQRETAIIWDRETGEPVYNAIVWQDRRTADACDALEERGVGPMLRAKTGLPIDPYFSATKIGWILDNVDGARERAEAGELAFGTIDCWLAWNLSSGTVHVTDITNASRTQLLDINTGAWDQELLDLFGVPATLLPEVVPSSGVVGHTDPALFSAPIPIAGICGDQQSSLAGHGAFEPGGAKATFGTGVFALLNTGAERPTSDKLAVTIAAQTGDAIEYAVEGTIFMGGAVVQWLVESLHVADDPAAAQALAESVGDSGGVVMVPALTGMGAPVWDAYARGAIVGLTRGSTDAHVSRAAMESIPLQLSDLTEVMIEDSGHDLTALRVDGGVTVNSLIMQTLANLLEIPIHTAAVAESTALGAAFLAGRATGVWDGPGDLPALREVGVTYEPDPSSAEQTAELRHLWRRALPRALGWLEE
jgi:glycerol kinase